MEKKINRHRTAKNSKEISIVVTPAEALLLWRRRKGWNQTTAAEHYGMKFFTYKKAEYGKGKVPSVKIGKITENEKCSILRKRNNKTQEEIAFALGCSKYWIYLQEMGKVPCDQLVEYWRMNQ